eukprot:jgi/Mesvir1/9653/Mv12144-RA.1
MPRRTSVSDFCICPARSRGDPRASWAVKLNDTKATLGFGTSCHSSSCRLNQEKENIMEGDAQIVEEGRKIRRHYHDLKRKWEDKKAKATTADPQAFTEALKDANQTLQNVTRTREQALDVTFFRDLTEYGVEFSKQLAPGTATLDPSVFLRAIIAKYPGPGGFVNWEAFGAACSCQLKTAPSFDCMLGPLASEPKRRAVGGPRFKHVLPGVTTAPEKVDNTVETKVTQTDRNIQEMAAVLSNAKKAAAAAAANNHAGSSSAAASRGVPVADLVTSRGSFAETVENVFALAFLVNMGRAAVAPDEGQDAFVAELRKPPPQGPQVERCECVVRLDMRTWQEMQQISTKQCMAPREKKARGSKE